MPAPNRHTARAAISSSELRQGGARVGSTAEWLAHVLTPAIAEVSGAAGMSRQAANQRWGKPPPATARDSPDEPTGGSPANPPG